jgi:ribosomal protein S18 acetylase RimI-like enzyme
MSAPGITFRSVTDADIEFLYRVYASTRTEELAVVDWTATEKDAFLRSQFAAQHQAYAATYRGADFRVILQGEQAIGRLYLDHREGEIRVVDIALLPECRNAGLGTAILTDLMAGAAREAKRISIHVEMFNPAQRLYERLGFRRVAEHGVYYLLEWTSASG